MTMWEPLPDFNPWEEVLGDDIVVGGVAYSRDEYTLDPEEGVRRLDPDERAARQAMHDVEPRSDYLGTEIRSGEGDGVESDTCVHDPYVAFLSACNAEIDRRTRAEADELSLDLSSPSRKVDDIYGKHRRQVVDEQRLHNDELDRVAFGKYVEESKDMTSFTVPVLYSVEDVGSRLVEQEMHAGTLQSGDAETELDQIAPE